MDNKHGSWCSMNQTRKLMCDLDFILIRYLHFAKAAQLLDRFGMELTAIRVSRLNRQFSNKHTAAIWWCGNWTFKETNGDFALVTFSLFQLEAKGSLNVFGRNLRVFDGSTRLSFTYGTHLKSKKSSHPRSRKDWKSREWDLKIFYFPDPFAPQTRRNQRTRAEHKCRLVWNVSCLSCLLYTRISRLDLLLAFAFESLSQCFYMFFFITLLSKYRKLLSCCLTIIC